MIASHSLFLLLMVSSAFGHGDLHDRISQITGEINKSPSAAQHFKRGCLYLEHGEAEAALADFSEAERLGDGTLQIDGPRAEGFMLLGKNRLALETLNRCLDRDPSASRCFVLRARVLDRLGESVAALHDYRKALVLVSEPDPDFLLEVSNALAKDKQITEALQVLDQGIARLGSLPSLITAAIEIEFGSGNIERALLRVDLARNAAPRPEPWLARRASILARSGRIRESQTEWQLLLEHISSLPAGERDSHAMYCCAREARAALAILKSNSQ
jgi:tetratricopeptide (TPR) repeat protein